MKKEELIKAIILLNGVNSTSWNMVRQVVGEFSSSSVKVVSKKWNDSYKEKYIEHNPLDLSKINTWSTFDRTCIELFFTFEDEKINCNAKIYDGESFGGHRKDLRFSAELILSDDFIMNLGDIIEWKLQDHLEDAHTKHLERQKKLWMDNLKKKILS